MASRRLLSDELVNKIYRGYHSSPKRLVFYLPEQLRLSTSTATPIGSAFTVIAGTVSSSDILPPEDFGDSVQLFKVLRAYYNTLSFVSIADPTWFPFHVGEDLADQSLEWMNTKYDTRRHRLGSSSILTPVSDRC